MTTSKTLTMKFRLRIFLVKYPKMIAILRTISKVFVLLVWIQDTFFAMQILEELSTVSFTAEHHNRNVFISKNERFLAQSALVIHKAVIYLHH